MFKIIKKLLKIEKVSEIKIQDRFEKHPPREWKMISREKFYLNFDMFFSTIVLDKNNVLIDGYTSYLLAKKYNKKYVEVERVER